MYIKIIKRTETLKKIVKWTLTGAKIIPLLMKIFGPKRKDVVECWRTLRNEGGPYFVVLSKYYESDRIKEKKGGRNVWTS